MDTGQARAFIAAASASPSIHGRADQLEGPVCPSFEHRAFEQHRARIDESRCRAWELFGDGITHWRPLSSKYTRGCQPSSGTMSSAAPIANSD